MPEHNNVPYFRMGRTYRQLAGFTAFLCLLFTPIAVIDREDLGTVMAGVFALTAVAILAWLHRNQKRLFLDDQALWIVPKLGKSTCVPWSTLADARWSTRGSRGGGMYPRSSGSGAVDVVGSVAGEWLVGLTSDQWVLNLYDTFENCPRVTMIRAADLYEYDSAKEYLTMYLERWQQARNAPPTSAG